MGKYFYSKNFEARNILEIDIDIDAILKAPLAKTLADCEDFSAQSDLFSIRKPSWGGDIRWISSKTIDCYGEFNRCFQLFSLPDLLKEIIDYSSEIRMYAGFLVERSSSKISYHIDWGEKLHNNAFTLITPIRHPADGLNLLYKDIKGKERIYRYKYGKAVLFGSELIHSTEQGMSCKSTKLLCFQFGTDLGEYNQRVVDAMGSQCALFRLPGGQFIRSKKIKKKIKNSDS